MVDCNQAHDKIVEHVMLAVTKQSPAVQKAFAIKHGNGLTGWQQFMVNIELIDVKRELFATPELELIDMILNHPTKVLDEMVVYDQLHQYGMVGTVNNLSKNIETYKRLV
jgi:hypothetical protein